MFFIDQACLRRIIRQLGVVPILKQVIEETHTVFARWSEFSQEARHASHHPEGVIELMPCHDQQWYSFKCVNGHPNNPLQGKSSVVAFGALLKMSDGYPVLLSEMTYLTALRTAATSAVAATFGARPKSQRLGVIGTGAQAEFQVLALQQVLSLTHCYYYDQDPQAMEKFAANVSDFSLQLMPCASAREVVEASEVLVTMTAAKAQQRVVEAAWLQPGQFVCAIGGDCPGKTELDPACLTHRVLVEYAPQTRIEGELQQCPDKEVMSLWQCAQGETLRQSESEIVIFDGVGFSLEDHAVLQVMYQIAQRYPNLVGTIDWLSSGSSPKDLWSTLVCGE